MIVHRDTRHGPPQVTIRMTVAEFIETVEWLELLAPDDGCTRHWRDALDRIGVLPPSDAELDASQAPRPSPNT